MFVVESISTGKGIEPKASAANLVRVGGHATLDLRMEYAFHPDWTVLARVTNLFDRDYQLVDWYNQPGREFGLNLRWQPAR